MIYVSSDPKTLIGLSRLPDLVTEFFDLDLEDRPSYDAPFVWWQRSKANEHIAVPMPEPVTFAAANGRGPLWHQEQLIHWFGMWRGLDVPVCIEAGDKLSARGRRTYSPHRERG